MHLNRQQKLEKCLSLTNNFTQQSSNFRSMFLIDKPFVSDFLLETLLENKYPIVATPDALDLAGDLSLNWVSEIEAQKAILGQADIPIYTNSENSLVWMVQNIGTSSRTKNAQLFKNKEHFRNLIKNSFPDFQYQSISLDEIQTFRPEQSIFPFVIKPAVGFFSFGVFIIHNYDDWEKAKNELNYEKLRTIFPKAVLDISTFIIEEYISGKE